MATRISFFVNDELLERLRVVAEDLELGSLPAVGYEAGVVTVEEVCKLFVYQAAYPCRMLFAAFDDAGQRGLFDEDHMS